MKPISVSFSTPDIINSDQTVKVYIENLYNKRCASRTIYYIQVQYNALLLHQHVKLPSRAERSSREGRRRTYIPVKQIDWLNPLSLYALVSY